MSIALNEDKELLDEMEAARQNTVGGTGGGNLSFIFRRGFLQGAEFQGRRDRGGTNDAPYLLEYLASVGINPDSLFIRNLRKEFHDSHVLIYLKEMQAVCQHCWDAPRGCQCWNDD